MRRIYHARQRIITTTSLQHRRTNGGAARLAVVPLKKRKTRIRRKVKLAPDLQHARACLYNNFLAPPAHNGSSARLRLFHRKTEEPQTTESKTCAGLQGRAGRVPKAERLEGMTTPKSRLQKPVAPKFKVFIGGK